MVRWVILPLAVVIVVVAVLSVCHCREFGFSTQKCSSCFNNWLFFVRLSLFNLPHLYRLGLWYPAFQPVIVMLKFVLRKRSLRPNTWMWVAQQLNRMLPQESQSPDEKEHRVFEIIRKRMNCMRSTQRDVLELCGPLPIVLHPLDVIDPIIAVMMLINSSSKCVVNIEKIKKGKQKRNRTFLDRQQSESYVRDSLQILLFRM